MGIEDSLVKAIASWREETGALSEILRAIADAGLLKGAVLVALAIAAALWRWRGGSIFASSNAFLIRFSIAAVSAIAAARVLQHLLPHRDRPFVEFSIWGAGSKFGAENSFPSDHAAYMSAMATATFFADRKLGMIALAWTFIVILIPRVLLNYHYPTDIMAGALIGALIAFAIMKAPAPPSVARLAADAEARAPHIIYPLAFIFAFEMASNFNSVRAIASALLK